MNDTKEHIIKTSLSLFLQKSYRDVTMSEIVDKTGLSKGAFYHYFKSKEELFKEIAELFFSMGAVDYNSFRKDTLKEFYTDYVEFLNRSMLALNSLVNGSKTNKGNFNVLMIMFEVISRFPEFMKKELDIHNQDIKEWKKVIEMARRKGEIKSSSTDDEIANLFLYCTDGVFLRFVNQGKNKSYKDFLMKAYNSIYVNLKS